MITKRIVMIIGKDLVFLVAIVVGLWKIKRSIVKGN